jgi:MbtH protein
MMKHRWLTVPALAMALAASQSRAIVVYAPPVDRLVLLLPAVADDADDGQVYRVVMNDREQYSIWPANRDLPLGWRDTGHSGSKGECLAYIESVWTDMRPGDLRRQMEQADAAAQAAAVNPAPVEPVAEEAAPDEGVAEEEAEEEESEEEESEFEEERAWSGAK